MLTGFRNFIARGNVIDLAVGVIMGAAFTGVVDSLSTDLITPIFGLVGGLPNFSDYKFGGFGIGHFVDAVISFLIKAAGLYFFVVLPFNRFAARLAAPPTPTETLLAEIRDSLRAQEPRTLRPGSLPQ